MARGKLAFTQANLARAMKAARVAGFSVLRVEVDGLGKVAILAATPQEVESIKTMTKDQATCERRKKVYD
jgi:hypothetical protein